jgi:hypothetical protein
MAGTDDDDDLLVKLSAPPATSPLRVGAAIGAALLVGAATPGCQQPGEAPNDAGYVSCDCGEAPRDTNYHPPDVGTDASVPGELPVARDAGTDAGDHPDGALLDAGATDV